MGKRVIVQPLVNRLKEHFSHPRNFFGLGYPRYPFPVKRLDNFQSVKTYLIRKKLGHTIHPGQGRWYSRKKEMSDRRMVYHLKWSQVQMWWLFFTHHQWFLLENWDYLSCGFCTMDNVEKFPNLLLCFLSWCCRSLLGSRLIEEQLGDSPS